jgi:hypothetical protein
MSERYQKIGKRLSNGVQLKRYVIILEISVNFKQINL